jgi:hypothetical protein
LHNKVVEIDPKIKISNRKRLWSIDIKSDFGSGLRFPLEPSFRLWISVLLSWNILDLFLTVEVVLLLAATVGGVVAGVGVLDTVAVVVVPGSVL